MERDPAECRGRLWPLRTSGADAVVQLVGGVGMPAVQAQANRLLGELTGLVGASPTFVPAPGLVGTPSIRRSLLDDPAMAPVSASWDTLTMALVGIGSLRPSPLLRDSGNAIATVDQRELLASGAVGDVCHRFFDSVGELVASGLDDRVVGIDPEDFRRIARRVAFAGGEAKHPAIRAAITGGWVNVLVADVATARSLVAD